MAQILSVNHQYVTNAAASDDPDSVILSASTRDDDADVSIYVRHQYGALALQVGMTTDEARALLNSLTQSLLDVDTKARLAAEHEQFLQVQARLHASKEI